MPEPRIIDLSYPVHDAMVVYPNTERPSFSWRGRVNSEGFNLTRMSLLVHTGTHIDSPLHFIEDGLPIDQIELDRFYGETRLFRVRSGANGKEFGAEDLEPSIDQLEDGSIFVLQTGIGRYAETAEYNSRFPWPSMDLTQLLIRKGIKSYMTDATCVDPVDSVDSRIHKEFFRSGIPIVENLANLDKLPEDGKFIICAMPLKLSGREGSPCRAAAIIV